MEKPGYKTTEFWLSVLAMLVSALFASGALGDGGLDLTIASLLATVLAAAGYTVPRTLGKGRIESAKALAAGVVDDPE